MKTNPAARVIWRIRVIVACLALMAIAGLDFQLSKLLVARLALISAPQVQGPPAPNVNLGDLFAAAP